MQMQQRLLLSDTDADTDAETETETDTAWLSNEQRILRTQHGHQPDQASKQQPTTRIMVVLVAEPF